MIIKSLNKIHFNKPYKSVSLSDKKMIEISCCLLVGLTIY